MRRAVRLGSLAVLAAILWIPLALQAQEEPSDHELARQAFDAGRFAEAAAIAQRSLSQRPDDGEARHLLVRALLGANDLGGADAAATLASEREPEAALTFVTLGEVRVRQGKLAEAERFYREAVRRDPELAGGHYGLGRMLLTQGHRLSARQAFERARQLGPDDPALALAVARLTPDVAVALDLVRSAAEKNVENDRSARLDAAIAMLEGLEDERPCRPLAGPSTITLRLIEETGQRWSVKVATGGKRPVKMALDTGADGLLLDPRVVQEAAVRLLAEGAVGGLGDGDTLASAEGIMPRIGFGELALADCPVRIAKTMFRVSTRGLIGTSVFEDFRLAFDFSRKTLELERMPPLVDAEGRPTLQDSTPGPEHQGWSRVRLWGSHVFIEVRVNGVQSAWFLIDTGAPFNMLDQSLASELVMLKRYTKFELHGVSGKVQEVYQATEPITLALAGLQQANEGMLAVDLSEMSADFGLEIGGIIGIELLRHLDFRLDYRNSLALLAPRRGSR